jgi:hypothetical protein
MNKEGLKSVQGVTTLHSGPAGLFRPGGASPVDLSNTTRPCPRRTIFARRCLYLGSIGLSRVIYSLEKFYFEDLKNNKYETVGAGITPN